MNKTKKSSGSKSKNSLQDLKETLKSKPFIIMNVDPNDGIKILASNKIDAGEMTGKFELYTKQKSLSGNHLIIFDGKKQQIIKLDAFIGLTEIA